MGWVKNACDYFSQLSSGSKIPIWPPIGQPVRLTLDSGWVERKPRKRPRTWGCIFLRTLPHPLGNYENSMGNYAWVSMGIEGRAKELRSATSTGRADIVCMKRITLLPLLNNWKVYTVDNYFRIIKLSSREFTKLRLPNYHLLCSMQTINGYFSCILFICKGIICFK